MKIAVSLSSPASFVADLLAVGVRGPQPQKDSVVRALDRAAGGALLRAIGDDEFKAREGHTLTIAGAGRLKARRVLLVGLGEDEPGLAAFRLFGVKAGRAAAERQSLAVVAPSGTGDVIEALAEGIETGAYRFSRYLTGKRRPKRSLSRATVLLAARPAVDARLALERGSLVAQSVNLARDLVNTPANDLTATDLANIAAAEAKAAGVQCKVFDKKGIERLGMPLLLAVNRGSVEEPRFVHLTYRPRGAGERVPRVAFVGKGLTFDSGGLCLKTAEQMADMKIDMAGSAVTLGIVLAAARLRLPVEVHGIIASTDNMSGGNAYRPGDVFPSRDGKTVEIINTDAEGRLVLADALTYARELKPTYLIDHATLTGACMVALGTLRAGLFTDDDALRGRYEAAAKRTGELYWQLPLDPALREQLKSPIADLKHTGTRHGGAITAALFLKEFVGKTRWMHVDIAGPTHLEQPHRIHPKGATGFGVRTAVEFLKALA